MMGNPGRRPLNDNEPKPTSVAKCPTKLLTLEARKEWRRCEPELKALGLLTNLDRGAFVIHCENWATYIEAKGNVAKFGKVVKTHNGNPIHNPYYTIMKGAAADYLRSAAEFGLSPSARTRLGVLGSPGTGDDAGNATIAESFFTDAVGDEPDYPVLH